MAASRLSSCVAMAAAVAFFSKASSGAYADGPFRFSPFSSSPPQTSQSSVEKSEDKSEADEPRVSSSGFDPESLERGAKALREINGSPNAKQVCAKKKKKSSDWLLETLDKRKEIKTIQS